MFGKDSDVSIDHLYRLHMQDYRIPIHIRYPHYFAATGLSHPSSTWDFGGDIRFIISLITFFTHTHTHTHIHHAQPYASRYPHSTRIAHITCIT